MVALALPAVSQKLDKTLSFSQLLDPRFMLQSLLGLVAISLLSGVYPAIIQSGFNPVYSLKKQLATPGRFSAAFRRSLVVFQFATSAGLIICTLVIARQMQYFSDKPLGFNKNAVIEIGIPETDAAKREQFRGLVQNLPGLQSLSYCLGAPITDNNFNTTLSSPDLPDRQETETHLMICDSAYRNTYGLKVLAGRWFLPTEGENLGTAVVVNEALVTTLGFKSLNDAIGKRIKIGLNGMTPPIVGVIQNFHTASLHEAIQPVTITPYPNLYFAAGIRLNPTSMRQTMEGIETAWRKVYPEYTYQSKFIDENLARSYREETKNYFIFKAFSSISIFICCIGLWGLIAFVVVHKTKEIGIRKVLGASIPNIISLLSKDFLLLIGIGVLVASPIAWYFMHAWLQDFAYRIPLSGWFFVLAGLISAIIALFTIGIQAIRAATANPIKSLRAE